MREFATFARCESGMTSFNALHFNCAEVLFDLIHRGPAHDKSVYTSDIHIVLIRRKVWHSNWVPVSYENLANSLGNLLDSFSVHHAYTLRMPPSRSHRASSKLRATLRAISKVSATVQPCATNPGSCSEVAKKTPSGNRSMCICTATSMNPIVAPPMLTPALVGYGGSGSTPAGPSHIAAGTRSRARKSGGGVYRCRAARR